MAKKGVARIIGETSPKVGTKLTYHVAEWHSGTSQSERNPANVNWQLYKENSNGSFDKVNLLVKGEQGFTFKWSAINKRFKLVGYLYQPEMSTAIEIRPQAGERSISRISFLDVNGNKLTQTPKYGQTLKVVIETINMFAETLHVSLWERDTMSDSGHDPEDNTRLWGEKEYVVDFESGKVIFDIMLSPAWAVQANKSLFEGGEHEFYLLVRGDGATTKYSVQQNVEDKEVPQQPSTGNSTPTSSQPSSTNNQPPVSPRPQPRPQTPNNGSQPASGNTEIQEPLRVENQPAPNPVEGSGRTATTVNEQKVEGLIDAYFAKKEYTKKTGEEAGTLEYEVKSNGNKTSTDAEKEKIAKIIFDKPAVKALTEKKEYTTVEAIKEKLTKEVYNNGDKITVTTFKLGEEFKKITSAPLEDKVYLVTTSYLLEGKEAKIIIKEKDGIIKGSADAAFPVLELTEAQMEQSEPLKEEERNEKSEFTGTFKDDIVKIPIQLRPKSDEELAQWKEKIAKGKEEGEYTYTFNNENGTTINDSNKKELAGIILENAKKGKLGNPKIEDGKTAYAEDVEGKLESKIYTKGETITFPLYKKVTEMLWLDVSCDGDLASYKEDFLKKEGAYFTIGKSKEIIFPLRVKPENDPDYKWESYYWAASQGANQATFNSNRGGGTRKHAGRDLYTNPETPVVAICKGEVLEVKSFYAQTDQVTVLHETNDGRKFIIRYGELAPNSISLKKGDPVAQGDQLGVTGHLVGITVISGQTVYMLHFEHYTGEKGFDLTTPLTTADVPFLRRTDLVDSLEILQEGYRNTFESGTAGDRVDPDTLTFSQNGLDFLKGYEKEIKENGMHVAFDDDYGFCTIGYGHLIAGKQSCSNITLPTEFANGLTDAQANSLLATDVQRISNLVKSKVTVNLYQHEFDALVSLAFNVEAAVGSESTLLRKLNAEDYEGAANEFKNWRMAGGVVAPGLVTRRSQETNIFKNNVYDSTH